MRISKMIINFMILIGFLSSGALGQAGSVATNELPVSTKYCTILKVKNVIKKQKTS